jgi:hypothetical protein
MKPTHVVIVSLIYLVIIYLFPVINPAFIAPYSEEDGVVESIGALSFLIASVMFIITYLKISKNSSSGYKKPEALWVLGLALLFFVSCG